MLSLKKLIIFSFLSPIFHLKMFWSNLLFECPLILTLFLAQSLMTVRSIFILKVNETRYIALFVVSGSIRELLSIDYVNSWHFPIFSLFYPHILPAEKCGVTPYCFHRNSLTLISWKFTKSKFFVKLTSWIMLFWSHDHQIDDSYLIQRFTTKRIVQLIRSYVV